MHIPSPHAEGDYPVAKVGEVAACRADPDPVSKNGRKDVGLWYVGLDRFDIRRRHFGRPEGIHREGSTKETVIGSNSIVRFPSRRGVAAELRDTVDRAGTRYRYSQPGS